MTLPPRGMNKTSFTQKLVGNIKLSMLPKEGVLLSTGSLTMKGTNCNVLLTSPFMTWGVGQHNFNGFGNGGFARIYGRHNSKRKTLAKRYPSRILRRIK